MADEQKTPANKPPTTSPSRSANTSLPETDKKTAPKLSSDAVSRSESKATQLFRSFLRWAGIALVVFGLGALAAIFLFYIPKSNELKQAEQDIATSEAKITELESEITTLENKIDSLSALEETNQNLESDLDRAQIHIHLLSALADIRSAQYALAQENPTTAKTDLTTTMDTLTSMQELLEAEDAETVDTWLSRLDLAIGELDSNPFAARSDLEVLAVGLLQLEQSQFPEP